MDSLYEEKMKKISRILGWTFAMGVVAVVMLNLLVVFNASGRLYDNTSDIPANRVGMLLGTSPVTRDGRHNYYFDYRIAVADSLFKAGKINRIIASGGDYRGLQKYGYDEPATMRDSLVNRGIPADSIILDYDGTRTIKSFSKAKETYGIDSLTIISQEYHNSRALYLARHFGIEAVAYNVPEPQSPFHLAKNHLREYLARIKMFLDLMRL